MRAPSYQVQEENLTKTIKIKNKKSNYSGVIKFPPSSLNALYPIYVYIARFEGQAG
jgi:hypothetical protein